MKVTFDFAQAQPWDGGQNLDRSPKSQSKTTSLEFPQSSWNLQEDCGLGRGVIRDTQMNLGLQVPAEPLDHGSVAELYQKAGMDPEGIAARILRGTELLRKEQRV